MEWLGAMFKGIGDTFTAGAAVDQAKIAQETQRQNIDFNRQALSLQDLQFKAGAVLESNNTQRNMILGIMGIVAVVVIIFIIKK